MGVVDARECEREEIPSDFTIILSDPRLRTTMPVTREELEATIRANIQVMHVEVEDNSGGCGEKFSVLIVSKVVD